MKSNRKNLILIGAATALIAGFGFQCVSHMVRTGQDDYRQASVEANRFLRVLESGNYANARACLTEDIKGQATTDGISDIIQVLEKRRGKITGHVGPEGWHIETRNGMTVVQLRYDENFAHGHDAVVVSMRNDDGKWQVSGFHFAM